MKHLCLFCDSEIFPEYDGDTKKSKYLFQCENVECGAIYESHGLKIPDIRVRYRPSYELNFDEIKPREYIF
jgi:hypothetical protein